MYARRNLLMKTTYTEYLEQPKHLTIEQMENIHCQILDEIADDEDAQELYDELVHKATKYAAIRAEWLLWSRAEKMDRDRGRTMCHDSLITHFNMLARWLRKIGKETAWRDALGYEEDDRYNRKTIGDFACYIVFINSINAR